MVATGSRAGNIPEHIITAAAHLFRVKGYPGTSVEDVSDAIGIKKASIYYYIQSKEELLVTVANTGIQRLLTQCEQVPQDLSPTRRLQMILEIHCKVLVDTSHLTAVALTERRYLPKHAAKQYFGKRRLYEETIRGLIAEGVAAGEFSVDNLKLATYAVLGMINSIIQWYDHEGELSIDEIASNFASLAVAGILKSCPGGESAREV